MKNNGSENIGNGIQFILEEDGIGEPNEISPRFMERHSGLFNEDGVAVTCREDGYMLYKQGKNILDSYWVCPECKRVVKAADVYYKLDLANQEDNRARGIE